MKKILALVIFVIVLSGCNQALTITEIEMDKVSSKLEEIIEENANENGNYLLSNGKEQYVFLNRSNVIEGEEALVLSNFKTEVKANTLYVSFEEVAVADYENQDLTHQLLYKIKGKKDEYDTIDLISNGESTHFDLAISY